MKIQELNGTKLKKDLGLRRVIKRYHNRNKSGGNFAYNLLMAGEKVGAIHFELHGYHDIDGHITSLKLGRLYQLPFMTLIEFKTGKTCDYGELVETLKAGMKYYLEREGVK